MLSELRIVTINKGQMELWLELFRDRMAPLARRLDVRITGAWVDLERERFIQIRSFADAADMAGRRARFVGSSEWRAIEGRVLDLTANQEVVQLQPIWKFDDWDGNFGLLDMDRCPLAQLRMYTVNKGLMPDWVDLFKRYEIPGHHTAGIALEWLSHDLEDERFVWIRSFQNKWDMEASQDRFREGIDWQAMKSRVPSLLAHSEVILMNPVEFDRG